ncbi:MAG: pimeloyl-[acyl-carrier protein] methyl ester esterase [Cocleimonas sp.]
MNNLLVKTSGLVLDGTCDETGAKNNSIKILMLLHGWGMNSQVWEPIREHLESQYHLIWVDLPGHGFNRKVEAENLEQIVDLIADVTPNNTHLIGWSLGGLIAQALEQKIPEKISSMTLVTSTPRFSQDMSQGSLHSTLQGKNESWRHAMSDDVLNRFADDLKQDTEKTLKGFIALQFVGVKNAKQAQNELINHILYANKTLIKSGVALLNNDQNSNGSTQPQLEQTNIPTQKALDVGLSILKRADLRNTKPSCPQHWIFSEYDRLIPKEVINDLISLRPNAEITMLEKAGHAAFITHSSLFLKHVNDFLKALA